MIRQRALKRYGGTCQCPCGCREDDLHVLQVDHVGGGGRLERDEIRGIRFWTKLINERIRDDLQLLCANCHVYKTQFGTCDLGFRDNSVIEIHGIENHVAQVTQGNSQLRDVGPFLNQKIAQKYDDRRAALEAYGNVCACCGSFDYLEIDHMDGNGAAHRAEIAPQRIEAWLRDHDYPEGFQLLCNPCNISKDTSTSCHLDHSRDIMSERNGLRGKTRADLIKQQQGMTGTHQEDGLVLLNTRISAEKKERLLTQASRRGIAAGQIIAELMDNTISQSLDRIEQKLDGLVQRVTRLEATTPADIAHPSSFPHPWTDPFQVAAYEAFMIEWQAQEQARQETPQAVPPPTKPKGTLARWFRS